MADAVVASANALDERAPLLLKKTSTKKSLTDDVVDEASSVASSDSEDARASTVCETPVVLQKRRETSY